MAASEAAKEAVHLDNLCSELDERLSSDPVALAVDNQAARDLSYNPELHQRTKHIDRRHFFVRDMVEAMKITVPYVNTHDNLADFFTKALPAKHFYALRDRIMNIPRDQSRDSHAAECGACGDTGYVKDSPCHLCPLSDEGKLRLRGGVENRVTKECRQV